MQQIICKISKIFRVQLLQSIFVPIIGSLKDDIGVYYCSIALGPDNIDLKILFRLTYYDLLHNYAKNNIKDIFCSILFNRSNY